MVFSGTENSKEMFENALAIYKEIGDKQRIGWGHLFCLYPIADKPCEDNVVNDHFKNAMSYLTEVGDKAGISQALSIMGVHQGVMGNFEDAIDSIEESNRLASEIGDGLRICYNLHNYGSILLMLGDALAAKRKFQEYYKLILSIGLNNEWEAENLTHLAHAALALNHHERAVVLLAAADTLYKDRGINPQDYEFSTYMKVKSETKSKLEKKVFKIAWKEGLSMSHEQIIKFALEEYVNP